MTLRVLIVDDEEPARRKLYRLLDAEPDIEIVAEAADGVEALAALARNQGSIDVVFLDVQMPRLDGFGVVAEVGVAAMPTVVFVTAYDQHALRAFEVHALDYLLKPFAPSRFARVLARLRAQRRPADADAAALDALLRDQVRPRRLVARLGPERELLVKVEEIDLLRAAGDDVELHLSSGELVKRRGPLSVLERRLDPEEFLRINRSEIVRLDAVAELQPWFRGDYRVLMRDGRTLSWSRRFRAKRPLDDA
ncbi:MAG: response regulator [Acidobacteriota bacterium]